MTLADWPSAGPSEPPGRDQIDTASKKPLIRQIWPCNLYVQSLSSAPRRQRPTMTAERWQSGRMHRTRNAACSQGHRGFESLPLRQPARTPSFAEQPALSRSRLPLRSFGAGGRLGASPDICFSLAHIGLADEIAQPFHVPGQWAVVAVVRDALADGAIDGVGPWRPCRAV